LRRVIGVANAPAGAGQSANAHGEFVHVGLADNDGAGVAQARDEGRVGGRLIADERKRSDRGRHVVGVEIVLHRHRHAEQRASRVASRGPAIERVGLRDGARVEGEKGIERRAGAGVEIARGDVGQNGADRRCARTRLRGLFLRAGGRRGRE